MFKHLDWDSNFFGYKVGQIEGLISSEQKLQNLFFTLRRQEYRLIYWQIEKNNQKLNELAIKLSGKFVDEKTNYEINLRTISPSEQETSACISEYLLSVPSVEMERIALDCGAFSRFNYMIDNNFTKSQFEKLYITWIHNSISKKIADNVFVYSENKKVFGLITLKKSRKRATIGLIGVLSTNRGKNIGTLLVNFIFKYLKENNYNYLEVTTQGKNIYACMFYEKCGFYEKSVYNFYHFWLY